MMHALFKPRFNPFCHTKEICRADCACYNSINCTVLQMEDSVRNHIVYFLNEIRDIQSRGEPSPSGMSILQYDHHLEEISMCWASQCVQDHSDCFATPHFNETSQSVGQMLLKKGETPIVLWNQMLGEWLGGVGILNVEIMTNLPEGEKGEEMYNYAQLLSDKIQFIGCSWAAFDNKILFVCTFGPRGPSQGDVICRTGTACSRCPSGYKCDFKAPFTKLCKPMYKSIYGKPINIHTRNATYEPRSNSSGEMKESNGKGDKEFLTAMTVIITIILVAVVVTMVGGFILYYIFVV